MLDLMRVLVLFGALGIVFLGILGGGMGLVISPSQEVDRLVIVTFSGSLFLLTTGLGLALAWQAWGAMQKRPSSIFQPKRVWFLALFFLVSVAMGHLILSLHLLPVATFPLFHAGATILPPVLIVALVARGLDRTTTWRDVTLQIASGAFLATTLAFTLEAIAILAMLTTTFLGLAIQPGGQELMEKMVTYLNTPTWLQGPNTLVPLLMSPAILAATFAFIAGIIPIIEEAVKTVGVGLMSYRHPTLSQAFLWGLAGGAGFALVEGLLNTTAGLDGWALVVLLRLGATLLHCLTGALMGLAWYYALTWRRWGYCLGLYATSVGIHALWNTLSVGLALLSLGTLDTTMVDSRWMWAGPIIIIALMLLVILALTMMLGLFGLTRYVRQHSAVPVARPASLTATPAKLGPPDDMAASGQLPSTSAQQNPDSE